MLLLKSSFSAIIMNPNYVKLLQAIFLVLVLVLQVETLIVAFSWRVNDANISCIDKERQALLELKQGLVDDYGRLSSWHEDGDSDCCNWSGIHCNNQTSHVEKLELVAYGGDQLLRGNISASLMDLQHLESLDLRWNDFEGKGIPEFFGSLTNLRSLDLSHASFGGKVPYQLAKLPRLQILYVGYNYLVGEIPFQFGNLSSLQELELHNNYLGGVIPYQLGNLSHLEVLSLSSNAYLTIGVASSPNAEWLSQLSSLKSLFFNSVVSILNKPKRWLQIVGQLLPKLEDLSLKNCSLSDMDLLLLFPSQLNTSNSLNSLFLSSNKLTSSTFKWVYNLSSNLDIIELDDNLLQGPIPDDFGKVKKSLQSLILHDNLLNGTIPKRLGLMSQLQYLDVGGNNLEGVITDVQFANFTELISLILSGNLLTMKFSDKWIPSFQLVRLHMQSCMLGPIFPKWIQSQNNLESLDLSNVQLSDTIAVASFLCNASEGLTFLNLSDNQLIGQIPNCWSLSKSLRILDLSNNAFSGNIPTSIGSLPLIRHIILRNNRLVGKLPFFANCTDLVLLDVGGNELPGTIPSWIGSNLQYLQVLSLRKNHFHASLPLSLCYLTRIQVLDLSLNNLSGEIPNCLKNLSSMAQKRDLLGTIDKFFTFDKSGISRLIYSYDFSPLVMWKGKELLFKDNKRLLNLIDLSSNQLSGKIPPEIGSLVELVSLDLSNNNLSAAIPLQFGNLQSLDYLNLSRNHLSGRIPSSLSKINRLAVLDLSNNNLLGKIPLGTQLQSFDPSAYEGNIYLCGRPLQSCPEDTAHNPLVHHYSKENQEDFPFIQGFYIGMGVEFFLGFWGIFGSLLLCRSWRCAYFNFLNNLMEKIYVLTVIKVAKCQGWLNI